MSFIHFISLKFIKTTKKNAWYFGIYWLVPIDKSAYKKLKQQKLNAKVHLGITNRSRFYRLQIWARGISNTGSLRDFKSGQKGYKTEQGFQIAARRFQIGAEITYRGKRDYKLGQGFQIGAMITNRCRTGMLTMTFY